MEEFEPIRPQPSGWTLYTMRRKSPITIKNIDDLIANIRLLPRDVKQIYKGTSELNFILVYDQTQGIVLGSIPRDEYDKIKAALGHWTKEAHAGQVGPSKEARIPYAPLYEKAMFDAMSEPVRTAVRKQESIVQRAYDGLINEKEMVTNIALVWIQLSNTYR
jgi:anionic cell wall polymer biosynthesis LytR-Cps2A-Psr (LCP) family protein